MRQKQADIAKIDPTWVKKTRIWIKRTFVPKAHYGSVQELIEHLKHLRDVDLNCLWEHLFYTKGLLPKEDTGLASIIDRLKIKLEGELKAAKEVLAKALDPLQFSLEAMTVPWNLGNLGTRFEAVRVLRELSPSHSKLRVQR